MGKYEFTKGLIGITALGLALIAFGIILFGTPFFLFGFSVFLIIVGALVLSLSILLIVQKARGKIAPSQPDKSVTYQNEMYKTKRRSGYITLNLSGKKITRISAIEGLEDLHALEYLNLGNNSISEIEGLETLRNLKVLNLANNSITEIKNLEYLTNLVRLNLNKNPIYTLKGLDALQKLKKIYLYHCKISEVESFGNKQSLETMALGKNPIYSDLGKIIKKKKKLRKMTEEQRNQKDIDPKLWQIADNTHFKLIYRKEETQSVFFGGFIKVLIKSLIYPVIFILAILILIFLFAS